MVKKFLCSIVSVLGLLLLTAVNGYSFGSYGTDVNNACNTTVYAANDCALCHLSDRGASTDAKTAYSAGGSSLTDFFCAPTATCTDNDNDNYATEGGDCGPVDCDDSDPAVNPGAAENCSDGFDNNCNALIDDLDPAAVGCLVCSDNDGDSYFQEGGACGVVDCNDNNPAVNPGAADIPNNGIDENCDGVDSVDPTLLDNDGDGFNQANDCDDTNPAINPGAFDIPNNGIDEDCDGNDSIDTGNLDNDGDGFTSGAGDCDDTDAAINPAATESCTDGIDNNCNGLVDSQDSTAVDCPVACSDNDGDTYAIEGGNCGPVDCNDNDPSINPGAGEICSDSIDNDCDTSIDEGCQAACPDQDGDGYQDIACGGSDCDDADPAINPGNSEVCGNGVDENCNGVSDDICLTCPDGTLLVVKKAKFKKTKGKLYLKGRASVGTTVSIENADTGEILAENIRVRKGKWRKKIKGLRSDLYNITVVTSNGCAVDEVVQEHQAPPQADEQDNDSDDSDDRDDSDDSDDRDDRDDRDKDDDHRGKGRRN